MSRRPLPPSRAHYLVHSSARGPFGPPSAFKEHHHDHPCPICGNDIIEFGEQCEGDTGGRTCKDLGFTRGTLRCGANCLFDVSGCML